MSYSKRAKRKSAESGASVSKKSEGWTEEERAAIRERAKELKADKADLEGAVLAKLAAMKGADRVLGERLHAIIKASAPDLSPKLWYGMPAYADKDGKMVCFFQSAAKFKMRYAMLGFSDKAKLDEGHVWPVYFALTELTPADESKIGGLLKKALS